MAVSGICRVSPLSAPRGEGCLLGSSSAPILLLWVRGEDSAGFFPSWPRGQCLLTPADQFRSRASRLAAPPSSSGFTSVASLPCPLSDSSVPALLPQAPPLTRLTLPSHRIDFHGDECHPHPDDSHILTSCPGFSYKAWSYI